MNDAGKTARATLAGRAGHASVHIGFVRCRQDAPVRVPLRALRIGTVQALAERRKGRGSSPCVPTCETAKRVPCSMPRPSYANAAGHRRRVAVGHGWQSDEERVLLTFTARMPTILRNIPDDDLRMLGRSSIVSPEYDFAEFRRAAAVHARRLLLGGRSRGQNDLTVRLLEILKRSHEVAAHMGPTENRRTLARVDADLMERVNRLQHEVYMLINNWRASPNLRGYNSSSVDGKSIRSRPGARRTRARQPMGTSISGAAYHAGRVL